ncbi:hypothetical protein CR513_14768, partial [Mucuna pruriens]
TKSKKASLQHPYETCSMTKLMKVVVDDLEERHKALRNDVNQLKEQISQILEILHPGYTPPTNPNTTTSNLQNQTQHQDPHLKNNDTRTFFPSPPMKPQTTSSSIQHQLLSYTLTKRLKVIEGVDYSNFNVANLCLILNVVIPPKFKLPKFDKYKGNTCPKNHLTVYYKKMASHAHDNKMLIRFSKRALWGPLLDDVSKPRGTWQKPSLNNTSITWTWLRTAHNYKTWQGRKMKPSRGMLNPPIFEKELVTTFIDTLQLPFYDRVIGNVSSNFLDLVIIKLSKKRVEMRVRICISSTSSSNLSTHIPPPSQPRMTMDNAQRKRSNPTRAFTTIPMTYTKLLTHLIHNSLVVPFPMKSLQPPYPKNYDSNVKCDYHAGVISHTTEKCWG